MQEEAASVWKKVPNSCRPAARSWPILSRCRNAIRRSLRRSRPLDKGRYLILDEITERNLELFCRMDGKRGRRHALGPSWTTPAPPMGGRLLEETHALPLASAGTHCRDAGRGGILLEARPSVRRALRDALEKNVYDIERLSTRIRSTAASRAILRLCARV